MIKFFSHIRKDLVRKNKTGKYFKYAIGEVVLVVIGILIALQINNLNEARKERLQEIAILIQLQTEFTSNLEQLDQKNAIRNLIINSSMVLLNYIDNPLERHIDSINLHISTTTAFATFDPIINDLASSGNLRLIKNESLKQVLSFWTSEVIQLKEVELVYRDFRNDMYSPFLIENYQIRTVINDAFKREYYNDLLYENVEVKSTSYKTPNIGTTKYDVNFNSLLDNRDFEDYLSKIISMNNYQNLESINLRKRIVKIIDLLNEELETK